MTRRKDEEWDRKYDLWLEHSKQNIGERYPCHVSKPLRLVAGQVLTSENEAYRSLYNFYQTYRREYRDEFSGLSKYRRDKLEALPGFLQLIADCSKEKWEAPDKRKRRENEDWNKMFQLLLEFDLEFKHCDVTKNFNRKLYNWIIRQRVARQKGLLDEYRIAKLSELKGFKWTVKDYQRKKRAREEALSTSPPASEATGNASENVRDDPGSSVAPSESAQSEHRSKRRHRTAAVNTDGKTDDANTTTSPRQVRASNPSISASGKQTVPSDSDSDDDDEEEDLQLISLLRRRSAPSSAAGTTEVADHSPNEVPGDHVRISSPTARSDTSSASDNVEMEAAGPRQSLSSHSSDDEGSSTNRQNEEPQNAPEENNGHSDDDNATFPMNDDDDDDSSPDTSNGAGEGQSLTKTIQQGGTVSEDTFAPSEDAGRDGNKEEGTAALEQITEGISVLRGLLPSHGVVLMDDVEEKLKEAQQLLEQSSAPEPNDSSTCSPENPLEDTSQAKGPDDNRSIEEHSDASTVQASNVAPRRESPAFHKTYRRRRITMPKLFVDGKRFLKPRPPRPWEKEVTFDMNSSSGSDAEGLPFKTSSDEEYEHEQAGLVDSDAEEVKEADGLGAAVDASIYEQVEMPSSGRNEKVATSPSRSFARSAARVSQTGQSLEEDADDEQSVNEEQQDTHALKQGDPMVSNRMRKQPLKTASKKADDVQSAEVGVEEQRSNETDGSEAMPPKAKSKKRRTGLEDHLSPGPYYLR